MDKFEFLDKILSVKNTTDIGQNELGRRMGKSISSMRDFCNSKRNIRLSGAVSYLDALLHVITISNHEKKYYINNKYDFGLWLRENRGSCTKYRIEKETGVKINAIHSLENNKGLDPTIETVLKLTDFFNFEINIEKQEETITTINDCIKLLDDYAQQLNPSSENYNNNLEIINTIKQLLKQKHL